MEEAARLLDETLQEEIKADKLLTQIATSKVNKKAA
jgi:ferritin-like metal-binding protein YciE